MDHAGNRFCVCDDGDAYRSYERDNLLDSGGCGERRWQLWSLCTTVCDAGYHTECSNELDRNGHDRTGGAELDGTGTNWWLPD
jgi:hypothetical protein